MKAVIEIATAADENYVLPLAAMLASIQVHLEVGIRVNVNVLSMGISEQSREKIGSSIDTGRVSLNWIDVDEASLISLGLVLRPEDHVSLASYARLLLPDLLSDDVQQLIYLDSDLICTDSINRLWKLHLHGKAVSAVPELVAEGTTAGSRSGIRAYRELGLPANFPIFNAGVMVLDLAQWREQQLARQAFAYLKAAHNYVRWHDQEAVNVVIRGNWQVLPNRWNHSAFQSSGDDATISDRQDLPMGIIHFNSAVKPWHCNYRLGYAEIFFDALDRTAWNGWRPATRSFQRMIDIRNSIRKFLTKRRSRIKRLQVLRTKKKSGIAMLSGIQKTWPVVGSLPETEIRAFCVLDSPPGSLASRLNGLLADGVNRIFLAVPLQRYEIETAIMKNRRIVILNSYDDTQDVVTRKLLWHYGAGNWCLCTNEVESVCVPELHLDTVAQACRYLDENGLDALSCYEKGDVSGSRQRIPIQAVEQDTVTGALLSGPAQIAVDDKLSTQPISYLSRTPLFRYKRSVSVAENQIIVGAKSPAEFTGTFKCVSENVLNE